MTDFGTAKFTVDASLWEMGDFVVAYFDPPTSTLANKTFSTLLEVDNIPFNPIGAFGFVRSLGSNNDGLDVWQAASHKIYLRKRGGGNLTGTFGATPLLQTVILGYW